MDTHRVMLACLIIAAGIAVLGGYETWQWHNAPDRQLVRACQAQVTERLFSPSSVKYLESIIGHGETAMRARIDLSKAGKLSNEQGFDDPELAALLNSIEATKADRKGEVAVTFDSLNRMGVPLRGVGLCTFTVNAQDTRGEITSLSLDRIE